MGKKYIIELLNDCRSEFKWIMVFGLTQEKQISVELIPEESLTPYTEPDTESIRKEAYDNGYTDAAYNCHERCAFIDDAKKEAYQRGYETAKHECEDCNANAVKIADDKAHESYKQGLSDAWETVKELFNFTFDEQATIFKTTSVRDIVRKYSASETIEKMEAYEQEQEKKYGLWIFSEANEPSVDTTLICSECGYTITIKPGDTQSLNFCPKCGDNKNPGREKNEDPT